MKLNLPLPADGQYHEYCLACGAEAVKAVEYNGQSHCYCGACGQTLPRSLIIDPKINWWVADDGEYWHETAGIFVRSSAGRFLLFERTKFPFGLTVPAGHVDQGEEPLAAAFRELREEVGIDAERLAPINTDDLPGDSCRRGSDAHRWHSFLLTLSREVAVEVLDEGVHPVWLTFDEAMAEPLTWATRKVMELNAARLQG